jgi:uncharacterized membrane protein YeaQ/YmgE (transglycosylase-associated protein family)
MRFSRSRAALSWVGYLHEGEKDVTTTALQTLVVVVLIGVIAGLVINRYGRGLFGSRASGLTASLVGIAGAFIGFHLGAAVGLVPFPVMDYLAAIAGAVIVLWAWQGR